MNKMRRTEDDLDQLRYFKYSVDWKVYDDVGNLYENNSKVFETRKQAEKFVQSLKKLWSQKPQYTIDVLIRELESQEIVQRFKKEAHRRNYKHGPKKKVKK